MAVAFHRQAFQELLNEDGLLVMARGLGLSTVVVKFIKLYASPENLVFVITGPGEVPLLLKLLRRDGMPQDCMPAVITTEVSLAERQRAYDRRSVVLITSRILVGDFLRDRVPPATVTGLIISHAERIQDSSTTAFVARVFRDAHPDGFVKAFSEEPEQLAAGFNNIEKVMNALCVKRIFMFPRFHATVQEALGGGAFEVVELAQPLTPHLQAMHDAVLQLLDESLAELRRIAKVDGSDLGVEQALLPSFDMELQRRLDPVWHRLPGDARQLAADVKLLRRLLEFMLRYDAVTFYQYLDVITRNTRKQKHRSLWLLSEHAHTLYIHAKARVHVLVRAHAGAAVGAAPSGAAVSADADLSDCVLREVLEPNPKLQLLHDVLCEAVSDWRRAAEQQAAAQGTATPPSVPRVLLFARDPPTCNSLHEALLLGPADQLVIRYLNFVRMHNKRSRSLLAAQQSMHAFAASGDAKTPTQAAARSARKRPGSARGGGGRPPSFGASSGADRATAAAMMAKRARVPGPGRNRADDEATIADAGSSADEADVAVLAAVGEDAAPLDDDDDDDGNDGDSKAHRGDGGDGDGGAAAGGRGGRTPEGPASGGIAPAGGPQALAPPQLSVEARLLLGKEVELEARAEALGLLAATRAPPKRDARADETDEDSDVVAVDPAARDMQPSIAQPQLQPHAPPPTLHHYFAAPTAPAAPAPSPAAPPQAVSAAATPPANAQLRTPSFRDLLARRVVGASSGPSESLAAADRPKDTVSSATPAPAGTQTMQPPRPTAAAGGRAPHRGGGAALDEDVVTVPHIRHFDAQLGAGGGGGDRPGPRQPQPSPGAERGAEVGAGPHAARGGTARRPAPATEALAATSPAGLLDASAPRWMRQLADAIDGTPHARALTEAFEAPVRPAAVERAGGKGGPGAAGGAAAATVSATAKVAQPPLVAPGARVSATYDRHAKARIVVFPVTEFYKDLSPLELLRPHFVILFDATPSVVREIEMYQANNSRALLRVYMLTYSETSEEHRYVRAIDKEAQAFKRLIQESALMTLRGPQPDARTRELMRELDVEAQRSRIVAAGQRVGGRLRSPTSSAVVVDERELRSALPFLIYQDPALHILPVTLEVGDYVLTPEVCVERKSVPDLVSSFASGRLFAQVTSMFRHYRRPMLLIEFDERRPFLLVPARDLGADVTAHSIISKIVLLLRHHPSLRLLWSRSPHMTCELFRALKQSEPEPSLSSAIAAGTDSAAAAAAAGEDKDDVESAYASDTAIEMLNKLPGVTVHTVPKLLQSISCLADLADMTEAQLAESLGAQNARKLFTFLHAALPAS